MITATKNPTPPHENVNNEFLQARNKLKKVSSTGIAKDITVEEEEKEVPSVQEEASENISDSNLRTLAILTDTSDLDDIIQHITSNGFTIVAQKKLELTPEEAEEFYQDHAKQNYYEKGVRWLSSSKLCALVLQKENAIKDWRQLMGPTTYKKARKTSPNSIRALFGKDASQNATHGSDSDTSATKEIEYLFGADLTNTTAAAIMESAAPMTAAVMVEEEKKQETKHEEPTKVASKMKQGLEGNCDVTASDTTPVSEKEEANNNNIKDTTVSVKESNTPEVHVGESQKPAVTESNKDVVKEEFSASNVPEVHIEQGQKSAALESKKEVETAKEEASTANASKVHDEQSQEPTALEDKNDVIKEEFPTPNVSEVEAKNVPSEEKQAPAQPNNDTNDTPITDQGKNDATKSNVDKTVEMNEQKEENKEEEQESSTIAAAANTVTSTAVSVATTVVTGVTEVASAAVTAVSAAVASSGTEQNTDNNHQEKTVTIEETPVIHNIIIPEPKSFVLPQETSQPIKEDNNNVVPEIKTADDTTHQDKSNSNSDLKATSTSPSSSDTSCHPEEVIHNESVSQANTDQGDTSSRTTASNDTDAKEKDNSGNTQQNATTNKKAVRKSAVHPSNSRIRPPSINKGHSNATKTSLPDTVKQPAEGSDHKVRPQSRTTRASNSGGSNGSNGATRIARLSAPIKKAAAAAPAPAEKVATEPVKKAVTKVSKNLPRVATLAKPPVSSSKAAAEQQQQQQVQTMEKPKKRMSSTKSFISRLTAPTVASANKKAAATATTAAPESEAPTRRTSTLKKRQSLTVKPTSTEAQGPNKATNNTTHQQQQQHLNSEMTSISTNESLSRPTTPPSASDEKKHDDKNHASFIDASVETTV